MWVRQIIFRRIMTVSLIFSATCGFAQEKGRPPATNAQSNDPSSIDLKPDAFGAVPPKQIQELLRRAEEKDIQNDKQQRDYTYIERDEEHKLGGHGEVKKIETRTSEILEIYGEPVERLTAKDDKSLSADDVKKEDEKIQKVIDKRKNESDGDRRKRLR